MVIKSVQKVIKIGTSAGITIPAKDLKRARIKVGDEIEIVAVKAGEDIDLHSLEVAVHTQVLLKKYDKALKNLANR